MYARVGGNRGADVDPDGRGIDEFDVRDALRTDGADVLRQRLAADVRIQRGDEAFQHHRCLAEAGYAGDDGEPPLGDTHLQRLHGMDRRSRKMNDAVGKELFFPRAPPQLCFRRSGEERPDLGDGIFFDRGDRPLGNDVAALRAGLGTHFHDPVRFLQNLRVVVNEDHGVSVRHEIVHHAGQPHDV